MSQKSAAIKLKVAEWGDKKELSVIYGTALRLPNTARVLSRRACHTHTMRCLMIHCRNSQVFPEVVSVQECIQTVNDPLKKHRFLLRGHGHMIQPSNMVFVRRRCLRWRSGVSWEHPERVLMAASQRLETRSQQRRFLFQYCHLWLGGRFSQTQQNSSQPNLMGNYAA